MNTSWGNHHNPGPTEYLGRWRLRGSAAILNAMIELVIAHSILLATFCLADASPIYEASTSADRPADRSYELGMLYLEEKKFALAIEQLTEAWRLGMSDAALHFALAQAYCELGSYLGAIKTITAAGQKAGRVVGDAYLLKPVSDRPDTFLAAPSQSAIYHVERALDEGLATGEARLLQARVWLRARCYDRAAELYAALDTEAAQSDLSRAERSRFYVEYSEALYGVDCMEGYLERLGQAVAVDPDRLGGALGEGYSRVAARFNQRGDLRQFIHYLELAAAEAPASAELHYRLGNGYWEAGHNQQAARQWQIVLEISPDHSDRARILELIGTINSRQE